MRGGGGGLMMEKRAKRKREKGRRDKIRGIGKGMSKRDGERDRDEEKRIKMSAGEEREKGQRGK